MMRWCPGQRCNLAVRVFSSAVMTVKCRCGQAFCFHCGEENHAPVSCVRLAEWNEKCKNESETAHWIIAKSVRLGAAAGIRGMRLSMLRFAVTHAHVIALECVGVGVGESFSAPRSVPSAPCASKSRKDAITCVHAAHIQAPRRICPSLFRALSVADVSHPIFFLLLRFSSFR